LPLECFLINAHAQSRQVKLVLECFCTRKITRLLP